MTTSHTPGEWIINRDSEDCGDDKLSIEVAGDYFIAQVDPGVCQEANARLISAAPELLASLQMILQLNPQLPMGVTEDAEAAVSKATGEAQ